MNTQRNPGDPLGQVYDVTDEFIGQDQEGSAFVISDRPDYVVAPQDFEPDIPKGARLDVISIDKPECPLLELDDGIKVIVYRVWRVKHASTDRGFVIYETPTYGFMWTKASTKEEGGES